MSASITPTVGAPGSRILGVGGYRPSRIVTNAEICELIDSSDEWIRERSGIIERRWCEPGETLTDMATAAAEKALAASGIAAADIDIVIIANVSHPYLTPSASAEVADRIGATKAGAIDLGAACAGFSYGVGVADGMVRAGTAKYVLLIGTEKLTDWMSYNDRGTTFLFADGAGAVVIGPSDTPGIGPTVWGADGAQRDAITMTQSLLEYRESPAEQFPTLVMEGQRVFRWAVAEMSKACQRALDAAGVKAEDLDAFIPHQANMRIIDAMIKALKLPDHVPVARDIAYMGNTSAASVPLAMERMIETGEAPSGGTALLIGFGAGLVFASQVVTLP